MAIRPPPDYVKYTQTAAWLRLGKIAVISVLAGLAAAIGLAFPDVQDAEAQGVRNGYTYTRMVCQEWGQQTRWYSVRDPIAGSDWRNDGGWAIVLVSGSNTGIRFNAPSFYGGPLPAAIELASPRRERTPITDLGGITGFLTYNGTGSTNSELVIDRNNDGDITEAGDRTAGPAGIQWEFRSYTTEAYGASYIRWASMAWCR